MRLRNIVKLSFLAILLSFVCFVVWAVDHVAKARIGPERLFVLDHRPEFLSESLALDLAQKTLVMSKYNDMEWEPQDGSRSTAPNGQEDQYLRRRGNNSVDSGYIVFVSGTFVIMVDVELKGERVVCQTQIPK